MAASLLSINLIKQRLIEDSDLGNIHRFRLKVVDVERQHLEQPHIVCNISFRAMGKEGKPKSINGQMPLLCHWLLCRNSSLWTLHLHCRYS